MYRTLPDATEACVNCFSPPSPPATVHISPCKHTGGGRLRRDAAGRRPLSLQAMISASGAPYMHQQGIDSCHPCCRAPRRPPPPCPGGPYPHAIYHKARAGKACTAAGRQQTAVNGFGGVGRVPLAWRRRTAAPRPSQPVQGQAHHLHSRASVLAAVTNLHCTPCLRLACSALRSVPGGAQKCTQAPLTHNSEETQGFA